VAKVGGAQVYRLGQEVKTPRAQKMAKAGGIGGIPEFLGYFADF
jgi:hypothetical protein